jgi:hypothetical protein
MLAAMLLAGCGATEHSGHVGDTFAAHTVRVTLQRVDLQTRAVDDVTGLGRPLPGNRLLGVRIAACVGEGTAIGSSNFAVELDRGDKARIKFPARNYDDDFGAVFGGSCGEGWLVFEAPTGARVAAVTFTYDDTGGGRPQRGSTHARFRWGV